MANGKSKLAVVPKAADVTTITLTFDKDTKNTRRYQEVERPGEPPVVGTLYLAKWFAGEADKITLAITKE